MLERLTDKDRNFIKTQVSGGYYASEIEVVRDAVRRLRENEEEKKLYRLRAMALKGHEQLMRGEGAVLDAALMAEISKKAKALAQSGGPIKDEVKP